jgi:hypothetical protein
MVFSPAQEDVDCASSAVPRRRVGKSKDRRHSREKLANRIPQDGHSSGRVQSPAVHDADAAAPRVKALLDEPLNGRQCLRQRLTMQVQPSLDGVGSSLQFPNLPAVHAVRGEIVARRIDDRRGRLLARSRRGNGRERANAALSVGRKRHHIRHGAREDVAVSRRIGVWRVRDRTLRRMSLGQDTILPRPTIGDVTGSAPARGHRMIDRRT